MQCKQGGLFGKAGSHSEQAARRDMVLPSEFYLIPATNPTNDLTRKFLLSKTGTVNDKISPAEISPIIAANFDSNPAAINFQPEEDQRPRSHVSAGFAPPEK